MEESQPKKIDKYLKIVHGNQIHAPVSELIGMRFTHVEAGKAIFEMPIKREHLNSLGTAQGGILTIMADAAMGIAFGSLLSENDKFTTIELKINFLRPVSDGILKAIGNVIHRGKRAGMAECNIYLESSGESKIVAKSSSSLMIL